MPTYKTIDAHSHMHFASFVSQLFKMGFQPSFLFLDQTSVVIARNKLAQYFVDFDREHNFDLCIWMDSDHTFAVSTLLDMLYHYDKYDDIEILSASYVTRDVSNPRICAFMQKKDGQYISVHPETKGIKEIDGCGFGCVYMKPQVMHDMCEHFGGHQFQFEARGDKEKGNHISEDLYWCERAKEIGYKIYLDADAQIGHRGGVIEHDWMKFKQGVVKIE